jgi:hypothetical protein
MERSLLAMLYAAKCYWPGVTETELEHVSARATLAETRSSDDGVAYLGSLLFSDDDLVLCLFEGPSRAAAKRASERAGIPCERLMNSVRLGSDPRTLQEPRNEQAPNSSDRSQTTHTRCGGSVLA